MKRKKKEKNHLYSTCDDNTTTDNDKNLTNDTKVRVNGDNQIKNEKDVYDHLAHNEQPRPEEDTYDVTSSDQNVYNHLQPKANPQSESEGNVYDISGSSGLSRNETESNDYDVSSPIGHQDQEIYNHLREELPGGHFDDVYDISNCNNDKTDDIYNHLQNNPTTPHPPLDEYAMYGISSSS
jgi:hypothetical protein